ncbi:MAG TPA: hypothetical protein VE780_12595 [Thermoleophilaceae bacterium]|nr:hypothetical protein [Thermoleophilaceae bacterium]
MARSSLLDPDCCRAGGQRQGSRVGPGSLVDDLIDEREKLRVAG